MLKQESNHSVVDFRGERSSRNQIKKMYTPTKVIVPEKTHEKLTEAVQAGRPTSVRIELHSDQSPEQTLLLTDGQLIKIERAILLGKRSISLHMSRKQLQANIKHEGGFLGMLAGLAARLLPSLLTGLATGAVSGAVEKAIGGDGLYFSRRGQCAKVQPVEGGGLYLSPYDTAEGQGLYLKHDHTIYGQGLLLGKDSPFKNIPILGLFL